MIDFERGAKTTVSKFYFLTGNEAVKEWKLILNAIVKWFRCRFAKTYACIRRKRPYIRFKNWLRTTEETVAIL